MVTGSFDVAELFNGEPVVFRGVPGMRCEQCSETIVSARVAAEIELLLRESKPPASELIARVFVFQGAQAS